MSPSGGTSGYEKADVRAMVNEQCSRCGETVNREGRNCERASRKERAEKGEPKTASREGRQESDEGRSAPTAKKSLSRGRCRNDPNLVAHLRAPSLTRCPSAFLTPFSARSSRLALLGSPFSARPFSARPFSARSSRLTISRTDTQPSRPSLHAADSPDPPLSSAAVQQHVNPPYASSRTRCTPILPSGARCELRRRRRAG